MKNGKDKNVTFSKILVVVTGSLFIIAGGFAMFMYLSGRIENAFDTTAMVTMITVSGTIFASNLCWYSKKSASENHYKLRMSLYKESADIRLQFNESMLKLQKEYNVTQDDIDMIETQSDADEMMQSALDSVISDLDATRDTADSENMIEQV